MDHHRWGRWEKHEGVPNPVQIATQNITQPRGYWKQPEEVSPNFKGYLTKHPDKAHEDCVDTVNSKKTVRARPQHTAIELRRRSASKTNPRKGYLVDCLHKKRISSSHNDVV